MQAGINFALDNIKANAIAGWGKMYAADRMPANDRAAFLAGVRIVDELSFEQKLSAKDLLDGSASAGDARQLPAAVVAELRKRDTTLDYVLSLVEQGKATLFLPPYGDEDAA